MDQLSLIMDYINTIQIIPSNLLYRTIFFINNKINASDNIYYILLFFIILDRALLTYQSRKRTLAIIKLSI